MTDPVTPFPGLNRLTPARVRLDASAGPVPMRDLLAFQEDHAAARDAIHGSADWQAIARDLAPLDSIRVSSRAQGRAEYLRRPDLGRKLAEDAVLLRNNPLLVVVLADGLSAQALDRHGAAVVHALAARLPELDAQQVVLASGARVALGDDIGAAMGSQMVLVLIGERPGLTVADSLGAYLTMSPRPGLRDNARNCVSNIHDRGGLSHDRAADRLTWLIHAARKLGQTGVALKDGSADALPAGNLRPDSLIDD